MIGEKLRRLRLERCLTVRDVSEKTGLGANTISRWENNRVQPKLHHLVILMAFYGAGMDILSDGEDTPAKLKALEKRLAIIEQKLAEGDKEHEHSTRR